MLISRIVPDPLTGASGMRVNYVKFIKDGKVLEYTPEGFEERIRQIKAYVMPRREKPVKKLPVKPARVSPTQEEYEEEEEGC